LRRHEQVHYDLASLGLRDFLNQATPGTDVSPLFTAIDQRVKALDQTYESYTGQVTGPRQDQWTAAINRLKGGTSTDTIGELERMFPPSLRRSAVQVPRQ